MKYSNILGGKNDDVSPMSRAHVLRMLTLGPSHSQRNSREDLVSKTMSDIPSFDRTKAEEAVDKFLLDPEMLNIYIQYGKEVERDPNFKVPDAPKDDDGLFSFRNVVILYILFIAATTLPDLFRDYVADQQIAGTWSATGLGFLDNWIDETTPAATAAALERAAKAAADTASDVVTSVDAAISTSLPEVPTLEPTGVPTVE